ncbi:hypothetical protein GCM10009734_07170 [Nonomuraea bangladeshensis]
MAWLIAGCDMPRSAAAAEKLSLAATRVKQWISLSISSIDPWCTTRPRLGTITAITRTQKRKPRAR